MSSVLPFIYGSKSYVLQCGRQPIVTGTSVLAIKYKDGIMMAADTLGLSTILLDRYQG